MLKYISTPVPAACVCPSRVLLYPFHGPLPGVDTICMLCMPCLLFACCNPAAEASLFRRVFLYRCADNIYMLCIHALSCSPAMVCNVHYGCALEMPWLCRSYAVRLRSLCASPPLPAVSLCTWNGALRHTLPVFQCLQRLCQRKVPCRRLQALCCTGETQGPCKWQRQ